MFYAVQASGAGQTVTFSYWTYAYYYEPDWYMDWDYYLPDPLQFIGLPGSENAGQIALTSWYESWYYDNPEETAAWIYLLYTFDYPGAPQGSFPLWLDYSGFTENSPSHEYPVSIVNAAGQPATTGRLFARQTSEVIKGRDPQTVTVTRKLDATGLSVGTLLTRGTTTELDITTQRNANGKMGTLTAEMPTSQTESVPGATAGKNTLSAVYTYGGNAGLGGTGTSAKDGSLLASIERRRHVNSAAFPGGIMSLGTTKYRYEANRNALVEMENSVPYTPALPGAITVASQHLYTVNALGQRMDHEIRQGYAATAPSSATAARRDYFYNPQGELGGARTSAIAGTSFSSGTAGATPSGENEQYSYDLIGNRRWAARGATSVTSAPGAADAPPSPGAGSTTQYHATWNAPGTLGGSKANTYGATLLQNTANPANTASLKCTYDADGNLLNDGKHLYTWNSQSQLTSLRPVTPAADDYRHDFTYDWRGRRVTRTTYRYTSATASQVVFNDKFYYDGWNMVMHTWSRPAFGSIPAATGSDRLVWGQDVSGTAQGAGGVGGLLFWQGRAYGCLPGTGTQGTDSEATWLYFYDGNGNVSEVYGASGSHTGNTVPARGVRLAAYRYDAFGNQHYTANTLGLSQPWTFSTKWQDPAWLSADVSAPLNASGPTRSRRWHYYGYRLYHPELGRWLSRDPIGERGGGALVVAGKNNLVCFYDRFGLDIDIGIGASGSAAVTVGGVTIGVEMSTAITTMFTDCWHRFSCLSVSLSTRIGVGLGEVGVGVGLVGNYGDPSWVGPGSTIAQSFGWNVAPGPGGVSGGGSAPVPGTGGSGPNFSFGSGDPIGLGFGRGLNFYTGKTYTGKVCVGIHWYDYQGTGATLEAISRWKEAYDMALKAATDDGWGVGL